MTYLFNILIAVDQLVNTACGGNPDETISSRVGRSALSGNRAALALQWVIDSAFLLLTGLHGHCRASIEWDEVPQNTQGNTA